MHKPLDMPELPEVETTLRGISPYLLNKKIKRIRVRQARLRWPVPDDIQSAENQTVNSLARRGKYIIASTVKGSLILHLGMSGSLRIVERTFATRKHDHVIFELTDDMSMVYNDPRRFGTILWTTEPAARHPLLVNLGPEPLSDAFTGEHLFKQSRKKKVAIKNFIMNGQIVVGVGNIYASEALFRAGIRPGKAAGRVTTAAFEILATEIKSVLMAAIKSGGTTLRDFVNSDGEPGYFQQTLNVYGREGEPCRTCSTLIKQRTIGQRSTFYCSTCQR